MCQSCVERGRSDLVRGLHRQHHKSVGRDVKNISELMGKTRWCYDVAAASNRVLSKLQLIHDYDDDATLERVSVAKAYAMGEQITVPHSVSGPLR